MNEGIQMTASRNSERVASSNFSSVARNALSPFPAATSIPQAFNSIVDLFPDRCALIDGEQCWTYAELDGLADRAAETLQERGVSRGQGVGLYMNRSVEAVVAMLAILKLGAVYVPFDPAAPDERLASQARNAGIEILTFARECDCPSWFVGAMVPISARSDTTPARLPRLDIHPSELAYVIHTSGSTNEAKGVCVTHRAIMELVTGAAYCNFVCDDVVYHGMSIAFDGSTFEIWGALLSGACLVVAPHGISIQGIVDLVDRHAISVLLLSTGIFNALSRNTLQRLTRVRVLLAGGDVMSPYSATQFLSAGGRVLVNGYGPTEVTTFSHCKTMIHAPDSATAISIGSPIHGTAAYVLDENGEPVPVGEEGELFIAGSGLARGYLRGPSLTAERFLPDPFAKDGSRMYRTGDLVRQAADGSLDYIGRIDTQVKIRGFRVELGEIEACLYSLVELEDVCVVHLRNDAGTSSLYAYAVLEQGREPLDEEAVLSQLRKQLPDYMHPRRIIFVDELPLTINGKVDRRTLIERAVDLRDSPHSEACSADALDDPLEHALMCALGQLLDQPSLARTDNFFEAGGDSLSAMRFCAQVAEEYGVDLPLVVLFEAESIEEIFARVRTLKDENLVGSNAERITA
ncbi:non-ribosomal peptide synthetase [Oleiagrimonas citrea]|uniref:Non-ribosomal peptide synthetase n=1 Tax=Oleiagrimonas citrea TaxID=1665687 RepID=A0A846ZID5_9GAMM|nr:non-ribosomal peptide synthetase [Oleiagrimonas citrea]NKZ37379.1 non-ribosomal peptide synthetase [Oleiagrimonas citrea]